MTIETLLKNVDSREKAKHKVKIALTTKELNFTLEQLQQTVDEKYGAGTFNEAVLEYMKSL